MTYIEQRDKWLLSHPTATAEEAWEAGYLCCTKNWCQSKR